VSQGRLRNPPGRLLPPRDYIVVIAILGPLLILCLLHGLRHAELARSYEEHARTLALRIEEALP